MNRRAYLSVVAALGVAGCTGGPAETAGSTTTAATATTTTTTGTTTTRTTTATTATTEEPTTETTVETTEEPETTQTTSKAEGYARRQLDEAAADLDAAYVAYLDLAGDGNEDPLAVTVDTATFDPSIVTGSVGEAQIHLSDAEKEGIETLEASIGNHRLVGDLLRNLAQAQSAANSCYRAYRDGRRAFFDVDTFNLDIAVEDLDERVEEVQDLVSTFLDTDFSMLSETDLDPAVMEEKGDQLERAVSTFEFFIARFEDHLDAVSDRDNGVDEFDAGEYVEAGYEFDSATNSFGDALDAIEDRDLPEPFADDVEDYSCVLEALEAGTDRLVRAADAAADGNAETANRYVEDAEDEYEECDVTVDLPDRVPP